MLMPNKGITIYCIWRTEAAIKLCKWNCLLLKVMELFQKMINDHKVIFIGNIGIWTGGSMKLDNYCLNFFPHITSQLLKDIIMDSRHQRESTCSEHIHAQVDQSGDTMTCTLLDSNQLCHCLSCHLNLHWKKNMLDQINWNKNENINNSTFQTPAFLQKFWSFPSQFQSFQWLALVQTSQHHQNPWLNSALHH